MAGMVYLVGAGPGDYRLISVRACDCLKKAQVVVYDRLADHRILRYAPDEAEYIYVGKASSRHTMSYVSPAGPVYQAGTLSGNPLAMTAGLETLRLITEDREFTPRLIRQTTKLLDGWRAKAAEAGVAIQAHQAGSMMGIFFNAAEVIDYDGSAASDQQAFKVWFRAMLEQGIYLAPSQFETIFVSGAHTDEDIEKTIAAAGKAFQAVAAAQK